MKNNILEAIAASSSFGTDEVYRVFETFKSYDVLVKGCELAQEKGYSNLFTACYLVSVDSNSTKKSGKP